MLIRFVQRYCLKLVFALGLLIGLQLPHFLQQYEHRLDAHYLEAQSQLQQYQHIADLYFLGNLNSLIAKHKQSNDLVFIKEAAIIEDVANRFALFEAKKQALKGGLVSRLLFLIGELNTPLFIETQHNYTAEIVLNKDAIIIGLTFGVISNLLLECLFALLTYTFKYIYHYFPWRKKTKKMVS